MKKIDSSNKGNGENLFPREIKETEKKLLYTVLPENKPGYKLYRDMIERYKVIGFGRFGGNNLILGEGNSVPDLSIPLMPVFAVGNVKCKDCEINVIIHEEIDDEIEIDISTKTREAIPQNIDIIDNWNYSEWNPGDGAPYDNSAVREVELLKDKFLIVIAVEHKKMWIHKFEDGVNLLIPTGKYYNNLMLIKNIRDSKIVLNPNRLFENLQEFSDSDLISAFLLYNKNIKRIEIDYSDFERTTSNKKKKKLFGFLNRG